MCGIAGWIGSLSNQEQVISKVKKAMWHRGPDAQGDLHLDKVTLIHNRLKIIDLSEMAAQPMCNEDGSIWIVFNGEIYNHHQLRKDLEQKGHIFKSNSDTEVIIHLYEEVGNKFPSYLKGMFAIAIYDSKKNKIILTRDRFGIKPLFYYQKDKVFFAFASELNSLKNIPEIDLTINNQAVYDYTAFFYVPAPSTFYKYIMTLMPGSILEVDTTTHDHKPLIQNWYTLTININKNLNTNEAAIDVGKLIEDSVKSQMESDVKLGSLLSGGIDSSLVSYYAQKNSINKINTFNVKFPDEKYDESWAALMVADAIKSNHQTLSFKTKTGTWDSIVDLLLQVGQPYADTSIFAMHAVSKLMKEHVTVALSGDGGDESFGGYTVFNEIEQINSFNQMPYFITAPLAFIIRQLNGFNDQFNRYNRILSHFYRADEVKVIENMFRWIRHPEHDELWNYSKKFLSPKRFIEQEVKTVEHLKKGSIERLSALCSVVNIKLTLLNDFLTKVDIASMKESLEVRVPMLDEDLFAFGMKLPHRLKTNNKELKHILRTVAKSVLPEKVANKPKWGFAIPVDDWVDPEFKIKLQSYLLNPSNPLKEYINYPIYKTWVEAFCNNIPLKEISRESLYQRMIMLLSLSLHLEKSVETT